MDMADNQEILNSLLADWHSWACGYRHAAGVGSSPMFRECRSNHRQWASLSDLVDEDKSHMEAMDAIVMAMQADHRTALQIQARNLCVGCSVWASARLPANLLEVAQILAEARTALTAKLIAAGIL